MANKHANLNELFTAIANAIRIADDSVTGNLVADDFPDIIANIETGIDTTETANPASSPDIRSGKIAYVNGTKVTGDMPDISLNAPTISIGSDGVITAKVTQSISGYLTATSNQATKSLSTQNGGEFTPTTSLQTIVSAQTYCLGDIKIKAMPTVSHANPQTPTLDTTNKKIVAKHTQPVGYIATQTTTEATASINMVNGGNTITPSASTQTAIAAATYAINAINVGPIPSTYKQIATGYKYVDGEHEMTVSGLSFKPSNIIGVPLGGRGSAAFSDISNGESLGTIDANNDILRSPLLYFYYLNGVGAVGIGNIVGENTEVTEPLSTAVYSAATINFGMSYYDDFTVNSDGFTIILYDDTADDNMFIGWWYYICW